MTNSLNCPLCSQPNQCAVAINKPIESCWCHNIELSKSDHLNNTNIDNTACICKNCAAKFQPKIKEL